MLESMPISARIKNSSRAAKHRNTVAFAVDQKYFPFALFVANQILEKELDRDFDITICLPTLSLVSQSWLNSDIRFCEFELVGIEKFPVGNLSLAAYHRLFLPSLFKNEYFNIFYMDADTYLRKKFLSDFFKNLPSNYTISAAPDVANILQYSSPYDPLLKYLKRYNTLNHTYRNSGVLLINTKNFISQRCLESILDYASNQSEHLIYHDQTALNMGLINKIEKLPFSMNWQSHSDINLFIKKYDPYIIHFVADSKPWLVQEGLAGAYHNEYITFLNTNFPDLKFNPIKDVTYARRLEKPKYKNAFREIFSRELGRLKRFLKKYLGRERRSGLAEKIQADLDKLCDKAEISKIANLPN